MEPKHFFIQKEYKIDAAHFIPDHPTCGQIHGHTFKITICVNGAIGLDGFIMDFKELDTIIKPLLNQFDHKCINDVWESLELSNFKPTAENMSVILFSLISTKLFEISKGRDLRLQHIKIQEGEGGIAIASI